MFSPEASILFVSNKNHLVMGSGDAPNNKQKIMFRVMGLSQLTAFQSLWLQYKQLKNDLFVAHTFIAE